MADTEHKKYINDKIINLLPLNPLVLNGNNSYLIIEIVFSKIEGIKKKISYERRVYESVDDESLS